MAIVEYKFNPFELVGRDPPKEGKSLLLKQIQDFVVEETFRLVSEQRSPVTGRKFKRLTKKYAAIKQSKGRPPIPDLVLTEKMLKALDDSNSGNRITIKITGKQGSKADGHNNHSGKFIYIQSF